MKSFSLIFSLFVFILQSSEYTFPQSQQTDRIINIKLETSDVTIANDYFTKAEQLTYHAHYDSANFYFNKASIIYQKFAQTNDDKPMWEKFVKCYNAIGDNFRLKSQYKEAMLYLNKALETGLKHFGEIHPVVATSYDNIGLVYWYRAELDKAHNYLEKAFTIRRQLFDENHLDVAKSFESLGYVEAFSGYLETGLEYLKKAFSIRLRLLGENNLYTAMSYHSLNKVYYYMKDLDESFKYAQKALILKRRLVGDNHPETALTYIDFGNYYQYKRIYNEALKYNQKAADIFIKTFGENHRWVLAAYTNMALIFNEMDKFDAAIKLQKKALTIINNLDCNETAFFSYTNHYLGEVYSRKGDYDKAINCYQKSLKLQLQPGITGPIQLARLYNSMGELFTKQKKYETALNYFQTAINSLVPLFSDSDIYHNPTIKESYSDLFLLYSLALKAETFNKLYWAKSNNFQDIQASLSTYQLAAELIDNMRVEYIGEASKLTLGEKAIQIFDNAVQTALQIYELTKQSQYKNIAYDFVQKGKAAVLALSLQELKARQFAGIPNYLLENEASLRKKMAYLKINIQKEMIKGTENVSLKLMDMKEQYFDLTQQYESLTAKFEKSYPDYYALKYKIGTHSINELQKTLDSQTALLEYFVSDRVIYLFSMTEDLFDFYSFQIDSSFFRLIDSLRLSIKADRKKLYINSAYKLYQQLVAPVTKIIDDKKNLVIIPHDILYKIPFEALLTKEPEQSLLQSLFKFKDNYSDLDFLIRQFNISYHYSTTLYLKRIQGEAKLILQDFEDGDEFIGFAPVFHEGKAGTEILAKGLFDTYLASIKDYFSIFTRDGKSFCELPFTEYELQCIINEFNNYNHESVGYFYDQASEEKFKTTINRYKYIHLATHSFVNEENPDLSGIAFFQRKDSTEKEMEDGILYAGEIYNLDLNADLVVLSSCEGGIGKIIRGEGIMALTRGFLYSGAQNIIFSLWKVSDKYTTHLMVEFYRQMLSGKSYADALRTTKLLMIKNKESAKPVLWSGFVLIGK